ncbi:MAG: RNA polymerase subunit sigma-70, partial [Acidobacteriaceae bacterium]|nr:RNA polymerase subunit sigma-70 [Acidobacteriaceae bacterium]
MDESDNEITRLLAELQARNENAVPRLFALLYNELRRLARQHLKYEREDHTLQATALVNEAYLRLVRNRQHWQDRAHFIGVACSVIRRILV